MRINLMVNDPPIEFVAVRNRYERERSVSRHRKGG